MQIAYIGRSKIPRKATTKIAFTSHHGLYCFTRMQFGLKNAQKTFQPAMDALLRKSKWQFALEHFYDFVVFWPTTNEHMEHFRQLLTLLEDSSATIYLKKCNLSTNRVDYVGHVFRLGCLEGSTLTIDAVHGVKHLTNLTEPWSFLRLRSVFWVFDLNFDCVPAPLKQQYFNWSTADFWQTIRRGNYSPWHARSETDRAPCTGVPTIPRQLYCIFQRLRQADWLCQSTEQ